MALNHPPASAIVAVILLMLSGCGLENRLIFQPSTAIARTPRDVGLAFQDIYFATADQTRLNGWFIPHPQARATLVWFHGNAGNISHRVDNIKLLHDKCALSIFIFDYRGYGRSSGHPTEAGVYQDGAAAMEYVRRELGVESRDLVIFGRSLGAAVAAEMAGRYPSRAVILESPFASIGAMANQLVPWPPIGPLLSAKFDNLAKVSRISAPLLVIHGERDEIVPFAQGQQVFGAGREPKAFYPIQDAGHNDTFIVGGEAYFERLRSFIDGGR